MKLFFLIFILFLAGLFSANAQQKGSVRIEADSQIKALVNQKKAYNKAHKSVKGYRIQLFYGSETGANKAKDKFKVLFPEIPVNIIFSSPEFKVQVGNYLTRLDADRDLAQIKKDFPGAVVLQTEIEIRSF